MAEPLISLILSCSSVPAQVKALLDHVVTTQPAARIEVILVAWDGLDYRSLCGSFHSVRLLNFPPTRGLHEALAEAVLLATTPIIVFLEDHVRVLGDWVTGLPGIFEEQKCAVVGWTALPGDLESTVSWAGFLAEYGLWGPGAAEGLARDHLPGHNTAYDRATLLAYRGQLSNLLRAESLLHWRFLRDGHRLYFTTRFVLRHSQFHRKRNLFLANFWYGWNFGDARQTSRRWGPFRRALYAGAIFLKPVVRWKGLLSAPREAGAYPPRIIYRTWPVITMAFLFGAVGEAFGYLFGGWQAATRLTWYEIGLDRSQT